MPATNWWAAPTTIGDRAPLTNRLDRHLDKTTLFADAEKMTVRVRGVMVREAMDRRSNNNDLVVMTRYRLGKHASVPRLHFIDNNVPLGWEGSFFDEVVLAVPALDIAAQNLLTLQIQVYDVDRIDESFIKAVGGAAAAAGTAFAVTFPHLAPLAGGLAAVSPGLLKLIDALNPSDRIIDERITLEINLPDTGHALLQPGYYVCFGQAVSPAELLHLDGNQRVNFADGTEFTGCSYAVIELERTYRDMDEEWENAQALAWVMAEINATEQGSDVLDAMGEMIQAYTEYEDLKRAQNLMSRTELTPAQAAWLESVLEDSTFASLLRGTQLLDDPKLKRP